MSIKGAVWGVADDFIVLLYFGSLGLSSESDIAHRN